MRSAKLILTVAEMPRTLQGQGPVQASRHEKIKLSFRHGGDDDVSARAVAERC